MIASICRPSAHQVVLAVRPIVDHTSGTNSEVVAAVAPSLRERNQGSTCIHEGWNSKCRVAAVERLRRHTAYRCFISTSHDQRPTSAARLLSLCFQQQLWWQP
eukprot:COSAG02_NODE_4526_length_5258_cov_6.207405_2_plen_103_part_00